MKARSPIPRTEEERQARREIKERCWTALKNDVPDEAIRALLDVRPSLRAEEPEVQESLAYIVWCARTPHRWQPAYDDCFSAHHEELENQFGRAGFKRINSRHRLVEITECGSPAYNIKLLPDVAEAIARCEPIGCRGGCIDAGADCFPWLNSLNLH